MQRIPSLDGLRAISIALVILSHLVKWKHASLGLMETYGALGVHIFFVLSGFLSTGLLLREHKRTETISLREFYSPRLPHFSGGVRFYRGGGRTLLAPGALVPRGGGVAVRRQYGSDAAVDFRASLVS